ncbi:hypothetical protein C8R45DRAFT_938112 [Mycena sanguinolenta]|nr:hypothetical protein C8R45DRAFT_938112 [Mycena sanguinolenta]
MRSWADKISVWTPVGGAAPPVTWVLHRRFKGKFRLWYLAELSQPRRNPTIFVSHMSTVLTCIFSGSSPGYYFDRASDAILLGVVWNIYLYRYRKDRVWTTDDNLDLGVAVRHHKIPACGATTRFQWSGALRSQSTIEAIWRFRQIRIIHGTWYFALSKLFRVFGLILDQHQMCHVPTSREHERANNDKVRPKASRMIGSGLCALP